MPGHSESIRADRRSTGFAMLIFWTGNQHDARRVDARGGMSVKKVILMGLLAVLTCGGYKVYQDFGPPSAAYRAYKQHADAIEMGGRMASREALARFGAAGNVPEIASVAYELESQHNEGEGRVRIVAVQSLLLVYRNEFGMPASRPHTSRTRHRALIEFADGRWKVTEFEKNEAN